MKLSAYKKIKLHVRNRACMEGMYELRLGFMYLKTLRARNRGESATYLFDISVCVKTWKDT